MKNIKKKFKGSTELKSLRTSRKRRMDPVMGMLAFIGASLIFRCSRSAL